MNIRNWIVSYKNNHCIMNLFEKKKNKPVIERNKKSNK